MKTVDAETMRALDSRTITETGTPGLELMERAAAAAAREICGFVRRTHPAHAGRVVFLAGKGSNGGDAYAAARILAGMRSDLEIAVYSCSPPGELSPDAAVNEARLPSSVQRKVFTDGPPSPDDFRAGDIIIDGLLGTGFKGGVREPLRSWINTVNASGLPVIALDIPSGLDAGSGLVETTAMRADLTVTIGLPKRGFLYGRGPELCGALRLADIGVPKAFIDAAEGGVPMIFADDARAFFTRRPPGAHKYSAGMVLVIGGSSLYRGAPVLAAEAALRGGAGIVSAAVPASAAGEIRSGLHSLIIKGVPDSVKGVFSASSAPALAEDIARADAIAAGPGVTKSTEAAPVMEAALRSGKPVVLDADGLNIVSEKPELIKNIPAGKVVLTPHEGEARRLLKSLGREEAAAEHPINRAQILAKLTNCLVVLKGFRTVIAEPGGRTAVNSSGSPALATAGTGDVLTGLAAAFAAQGKDDIFSAVCAAVFIHGLAGELSPLGVRGTTADDVVKLIPEAMRYVSPFA